MHSAKVSDLEVVESKLCLSAMIRSDSQDMFLGLVVDLVVDAYEKSSNLQSEREFLDSLTLIEPSAMETVFGKVTKPGSRSQMCIPYGIRYPIRYVMVHIKHFSPQRQLQCYVWSLTFQLNTL